jgi:hypothetical protein
MAEGASLFRSWACRLRQRHELCYGPTMERDTAGASVKEHQAKLAVVKS